jgi:O-antigen/teichoic acid export membrane protein
MTFWLGRAILPYVATVFLFRTLNALYEPLIISKNKGPMFFVFEVFIVTVSLILIGLKHIATTNHYFYFISVSECVRFVICVLTFKMPFNFNLRLSVLIGFLNKTKFYFLLVIVSFFQSRIDLYLLAFLINPDHLNQYQIVSSLLSLVQILLSGFVMSYSKLFYRNIQSSETTFNKIVKRSGYLAAILASLSIYLILNFVYHFEFSLLNALLVAGNTICFAFVLLGVFVYTKNEWQKKMLMNLAIAGIINLICCFILMPRFGIAGALAANTAGLMALAFMMQTGDYNKNKILTG